MKVVKADYERRIELAGVAAPVPRPVDIDQSQTGFSNLRTLRIYRFDSGSVIEGHAEEDEVLIIVLSGSVELTMSLGSEVGSPVTLSEASHSQMSACVAYLPPHAAYHLIPLSPADIAYARATTVSSRSPKILPRPVSTGSGDVTLVADERTYAERLRVRLLQIDASQRKVAFVPISEAEATFEGLIHVRNTSPGAVAMMAEPGSGPTVLDTWDTVSVCPGERPTLSIAGGSALVLVVLSA
jgi:hypothetical protein